MSEKTAVDLFANEKRLIQQGFRRIAGVDEAGRGPLAGPVTAAAVILPPGLEIEGLDDSKKLTEKKRETLFDIICEQAMAYSICSVSNEQIDRINILEATMQAMCAALDSLSITPDYVLIDGNRIKGVTIPHETIVKGDALSASIAAASILAKVSRDRFMCQQAQIYPEYHFEKHKAYGTREHLELIAKFGPSPIHRKTFRGVREYVK